MTLSSCGYDVCSDRDSQLLIKITYPFSLYYISVTFYDRHVENGSTNYRTDVRKRTEAYGGIPEAYGGVRSRMEAYRGVRRRMEAYRGGIKKAFGGGRRPTQRHRPPLLSSLIMKDKIRRSKRSCLMFTKLLPTNYPVIDEAYRAVRRSTVTPNATTEFRDRITADRPRPFCGNNDVRVSVTEACDAVRRRMEASVRLRTPPYASVRSVR